MCLGGGGSAPVAKPLKARHVEPGPPSPQDMVNNQNVQNINPRAGQEAARDKNRGTTASKQSSKIDKAY